jgi:hypothetical protein
MLIAIAWLVAAAVDDSATRWGGPHIGGRDLISGWITSESQARSLIFPRGPSCIVFSLRSRPVSRQECLRREEGTVQTQHYVLICYPSNEKGLMLSDTYSTSAPTEKREYPWACLHGNTGRLKGYEMHMMIHITFQSRPFAKKPQLRTPVISPGKMNLFVDRKGQTVTTLLGYGLRTSQA